MSHARVNPDGLHDPVPLGYSHTATVPPGSELVFVAGQYGSARTARWSRPISPSRSARRFATSASPWPRMGSTCGDVVQLRTYVVNYHVSKLGPIAGAVQEVWGAKPPTQTRVGVASLATPDMLIEVEAVAARP